MLRRNLENHSSKQDEVELSRRSFFGRFAVGAVLSIAMPGAVQAAKRSAAKSEHNHGAAAAGRTAVRLPKHAAKAAREIHKSGSSRGSNMTVASRSAKSARPDHGHARLASADQHGAPNSRVHDVYGGKKHGVTTEYHYANRHSYHGGRVHSEIQPIQRDLVLPGPREPMFLADRGRLVNHRSLAFQNPHTGDHLNLTYFEKGRYLSDALNEISFLLRDHRTDDVHPIDPELLDQLHDLKQMLGLSQPFDVICGYRSPLTNAKLHAEHSGVANNSFHMYGRAVDIRIERFDLRRIHNAAVAMHRGGVGYYPDSNFIHLDTGTFRTWSL